MPRIPRPYQQEAIERARNGHQYIALDCGLGKSLTAVETNKAIRASGIADEYQVCLIVVSPKASLPQWRNEINIQDPSAKVYLGDDTSNFLELRMNEPSYVVLYYEQLKWFAPMFKDYIFLTIIADEAHNINNRDAERTLMLKKLTALRKVAMSATPMQSNVADLWSVLNWFDKKQFSSYWAFVDQFCVTASVPRTTARVVTGVKPSQREEIKRVLAPYFYYKTKAQAEPELPPLISTRIPIELSVEHRELYDKIKYADDIFIDISEYIDGAEMGEVDMMIKTELSRIIKLQQVTVYPKIFGINIASAKMEWLDAFIANNSRDQMLVFTRFRKVAVDLAKKYKGSIVVGGESSVEAFKAGKTQLLFGTIAAMGTALDVPMASCMVFLDADWSSIKMYQASQRIHRLGIKESKRLYYLEATNTVDYLVRECIENKWNATALVYYYMKHAQEGKL